MDIKAARAKFQSQRHGAKRRGIGWELTFNQWLEWWGKDLDNRGSRAWNLQMQRIADAGPYSLDNIRKGTPKQNGKTYSAMYHKRRGEQIVAERFAAEMAAPTVPTEFMSPEERMALASTLKPGWQL